MPAHMPRYYAAMRNDNDSRVMFVIGVGDFHYDAVELTTEWMYSSLPKNWRPMVLLDPSSVDLTDTYVLTHILRTDPFLAAIHQLGVEHARRAIAELRDPG